MLHLLQPPQHPPINLCAFKAEQVQHHLLHLLLKILDLLTPSPYFVIKAINLQGLNSQTAQHNPFLFLQRLAATEPVLAVSETWMNGNEFKKWLANHPLGNITSAL
jgi:hypothetical protein